VSRERLIELYAVSRGNIYIAVVLVSHLCQLEWLLTLNIPLDSVSHRVTW
jgi:hypothetical protein